MQCSAANGKPASCGVTQAGDVAAQAGHRSPPLFCAGVSRPANQQDSPTLRCSLTTAAAAA